MGDNGVTSQPFDTGRALYTAITILTAIAWYNVVELNFLIFITFKRYRGLYFWALVLSSWGTSLHALGFVLKFFPTGTNIYLACTIITIGWYCMVTGQSVVLYSRIHLVVQSDTVLKRVLGMIIIDAILFHFPTTVLTFGSNATTVNHDTFVVPYQVMEKIQMTAFSIQEFIISGIYAYASLKLFRPMWHSGNHRPLIHLFIVNIIIIAMDLALLGVEYASLYNVEVMMKSLIYSIKLKLEFAVLTELKNYTELARQQQARAQASSSRRSNNADQQLSFHSTTARGSPVPPVFQDGIAKTMETDVTWTPRGTNVALTSHPTSPRSPIRGAIYDEQGPSRFSKTTVETELRPLPSRSPPPPSDDPEAFPGKFVAWAKTPKLGPNEGVHSAWDD